MLTVAVGTFEVVLVRVVVAFPAIGIRQYYD